MVYAGYGRYTLRYTLGVYMPPYCTPWWVSLLYASLLYHGGYTSLCIYPTIPPWVYHRPSMSVAPTSAPSAVRGERALGSVRRNPLGERP